MLQIERVRVWSLAKMLSLIGLVGGLAVGIVIGALAEVLRQFIPSFPDSLIEFWVLALVVMPVSLSLVCLGVGIIAGILYNLLAHWFGGVRVVTSEQMSI